MLPNPLAPLDPHKTRALTTIYAPRKLNTRKHRTAQGRMLDNNLPIKPGMSPFHPLPAIGHKIDKEPDAKVIVLDLNKNESLRPLTRDAVKLQEVLKPLSPLSIHAFTRKKSLDSFHLNKPQQLVRENTYDVIKPVYLSAVKVKKREETSPLRNFASMPASKDNVNSESQLSPRTRFKKAALQVAKLSSVPETGKLLCLRERETFNFFNNKDDNCRLEELPQSPTHKLNKLTEIFQSLEINGRHRDKMKKENSWF